MNSGEYRCTICWRLFEEPDDVLFHLITVHPDYDDDAYGDEPARGIEVIRLPPFEEDQPPA